MPIFYTDSASFNDASVTGSLIVSGSLTLTSNQPFNITGSVFGTASRAQSSSVAISSSFAISASWAPTQAIGGVSSVTAGDGLGGGTITSTGTITLDTSSVHFLDGVKKELNTEGVISSSGQFTNLNAPFTGSFTGSFRGSLIGTGSWANSASVATSSSFAISASWAPGGAGTVTQIIAGAGLGGGTITSTGTISLDTSSAHFTTGSISVLNTRGVFSSSGQVNGANITNNTVSYTAGAGLSGGGSATLGGGSVTIDAVAGAGISLTAPTNDAININTGSAHFTDGVKSKLNTDGVISSSTQFTSLTAPFTGSFTGSFTGPHTGSTFGTASWANTASVVTTNTVSYTAGAGLSGGGSATLGGASVTIDAVAGAGISLTAPTNDAINIDTASVHFTGGVKSKLNTDGVISSSGQVDVRNTTGIQTIATTGSNSFLGSQTITGSLLVSASGTSVQITGSTNIRDNLTVNGSTLFADSINNRVGIGTTSPVTTLHVSGAISSSGAIYLQTGSTLFLGGTGTPAAKQVSGGPEAISFQPGLTNRVLLWSGINTDTEARFLLSANGFHEWGAGGTNDQDIALFRNEVGNVSVQSFNTSSARTFQVMTSQSTEVLGVDTRAGSRRVRINSAAGSATLDLKGDSGITAFRIEHAATSDIGFSSFVTGDGFIRFYFAPNGDMYWGSGTAAADIYLRRSSTRNLAVQPVGGDSTTTFRVLNNAGSDVFSVDTTNTRIGIGTTAPAATIQAQGNVSASSYTSSINNAVGFFGTASYAVSASWAPGGPGGGVTSITAGDGLSGGTITSTGTIALDTGSAHFITGSANVTSSRAISASYADTFSGFINFPEGLIVTGSTILSGSTRITGSLNVTQGITGSLLGTSSWAQSASVAISSSFATTASAATSITFTPATASYTAITSSIIYVVDGGGSAITTGVKGDLQIPFTCKILDWVLLADQSGSVTVDIWKDTYANYPPTSADAITGSAAVSITNNVKNQSSTLTGWTTTINSNDILRFNVSSVATITRLTITLDVAR